jgi:gluconolactonase
MSRLRLHVLGAAAAALLAAIGQPAAFAQHAVRRPIDGRPGATIDLRTQQGAALVRATWRYRDARLVDVESRGPGPDLKPSGAPVRTLDVEPKAGTQTFDDDRWTIVDADTLDARRGSGRVSFGWYRTTVTIPDRVGAMQTRGSTVVFEIVIDDYAEVWVNGRLPRALGQTGGTLIRGFNAPNRVVLTRDARAGEQFEIAVFAANGPLSDPPANFMWVRSATLDFFASDAKRRSTSPVEVVRLDSAIDAIVPPDAQIEKLAEGFLFTEGPVWSPDGALLFSDPNANTIYRWAEDDGLSVFRPKSGYTGLDIGEYGQPGSNGLAIDAEGRLTINEHGNRRVTRLEKTGVVTVLADRYEGKRLNSPNDLVYKSDGSLYFTDPPFGLPKAYDDPRKELSFSGVYRWTNGTLRLVADDLRGPNGIAFSPDEQYLYVGNWEDSRKIVMRYPVNADGTLGAGRVFADMTAAQGEDAIDGVKVDRLGNVYVSGPGGLWIFNANGVHLGTIVTPEHAHNFAWGDADGRTLYLAARSGLYRVRLGVTGARTSTTDRR